MNIKTLNNDNGFSLVEIIIAMLLLTIGLLGMGALVVGIMKAKLENGCFNIVSLVSLVLGGVS